MDGVFNVLGGRRKRGCAFEMKSNCAPLMKVCSDFVFNSCSFVSTLQQPKECRANKTKTNNENIHTHVEYMHTYIYNTYLNTYVGG